MRSLVLLFLSLWDLGSSLDAESTDPTTDAGNHWDPNG